MKIFFLPLILILLPFSVFADIAGPVLTKNQACQEKDGSSLNRLQIFWNGQKSDTLYFFKQDATLYYVVSSFSWKKNPKYPNYAYPSTGLFLYKYDCKMKKSHKISDNLKKYVKNFWSPVGWDTKIDAITLWDMNYGNITNITSTGISLTLGIPQTWLSSNTITLPRK